MTATGASAPVTFLILGVGDLTKRLLLPGLASMLTVEPDRQIQVLASDRTDLTDDDFRGIITTSFANAKAPQEITDRIAQSARYIKADLTNADDLSKLLAAASGELVIYFALPPAVTVQVCAQLEKLHLPDTTRLGLEKPFGSSEASAQEFNEQLRRVVPEERIFRVDHFLGRATVLNLIGLRFANRIMQNIWSREHIERVEFVYDEDLALEGRAGYYDKAGALRDMLQSHLLQVLAIFAMEPLATLEAGELADLRSQVLRATHIWNDDPAGTSKRARYTAGTIGDREIPSYTDEEGVDPARNTETLAQMTLEVRNARWAGVPMVLRSGKGMGKPQKQIVCYLREVPHVPNGFKELPTSRDKLIIELSPGGVSLQLTMNAEGDPRDMEQKTLTTTLAQSQMTAYGEVLRHLFDNDQLLSVRGDAAELSWHIVAPVLAAFEANQVPMEEYAAGSAGPDGWVAEA